MSRLPLPREYILATLKYIDTELKSLPWCSLIVHGGHERIRTKDPVHEYGLESPKGRELLPFLIRRQRYLKIKKELLSQWKRYHSGRIDINSINVNRGICLPGDELWTDIRCDSNPFQKKEQLYHNGIQVRSRMEMCIGEILDQIGLEYVYEPEVIINGKRLSPDFVVSVPAFGCCIILEYLGLLDDPNYLDSSKVKIGVYLRNGYFPGTNLVLLCGNRNTAPSFDSIYNSIVVALANLCTIFVRVTDRVTIESQK